ncbi:MAG: glycosyltransferase family 2 protein [Nanoarchaeota archaeon]|nr:glycosyltransferase family 2 protein [Nanoarchaeota archaeon]
MKYPKVSIVVLNWNNRKLIKDCLDSLYKLTDYPNYRVVLVENGSTEENADFSMKRYGKKADVIIIKNNVGFCGGMNEGIKHAVKKHYPDYILLLSNDTKIIHKKWLIKLVETAESDEKIGIVGCKLIYPDGSLQIIGIKGNTRMYDKGELKKINKKDEKIANKVQEVKYVIGAVFLIKKELIEKIGLLDPKFYPVYGEEIDYCERARKNGFKIFYTPKSTVIHLRSQTTDPKKITKDWFFSKKNSIRLELLNYAIPEILYWQIVHFGAIFLSKKKGKVFFRRNFPKRFLFLLKAYWINIKDIKEILYKRGHRNEKIW